MMKSLLHSKVAYIVLGELLVFPATATSIALYNTLDEYIGSGLWTLFVCLLLSCGLGAVVSWLFFRVMEK